MSYSERETQKSQKQLSAEENIAAFIFLCGDLNGFVPEVTASRGGLYVIDARRRTDSKDGEKTIDKTSRKFAPAIGKFLGSIGIEGVVENGHVVVDSNQEGFDEKLAAAVQKKLIVNHFLVLTPHLPEYHPCRPGDEQEKPSPHLSLFADGALQAELQSLGLHFELTEERKLDKQKIIICVDAKTPIGKKNIESIVKGIQAKMQDPDATAEEKDRDKKAEDACACRLRLRGYLPLGLGEGLERGGEISL